MVNATMPLFGKTRFLENEIDEFLDKIAEGGIYFQMGMISYLDNDTVTEICEEKLKQLRDLEDRCSELRRSIATYLYTEMLIPDSRGDVLSLLQDLFYLIDVIEDDFRDLVIEKPKIPQDMKEDFKQLVEIVVKSLDMIIIAARAYFRNPFNVRDYIHKVSLYENEADSIAIRLKKKIFGSDLPLENKLQLRYVVNVIDQMADNAEDVSDWLSIYTIKRAL
jgi:uncharacterized protein